MAILNSLDSDFWEGRAVDTTVRNRALYLIPLFMIPAVSIFGHAIAPNQAVFKGQDWGILFSFALVAIAILAWLFYSAKQPQWLRLQWGFLAVLFIAWFFQTTSTQLDQSVFNLTAFIVPAALIMVVLKRPDPSSLQLAFLCLLYSLILISLASLVLGQLGLMPNGFDAVDSGGSRIPILSDLFGIENRWGGPFGSVNYAAPIGGLLFVSGLTLHSSHRITIAASGIIVLGLSQGRTSTVAVLSAAVILVIYSRRFQQLHFRKAFQASVVFGVSLLVISYIVIFDITFAGRTPIWSDFFELFQKNALWGVGSSGVRDYVDERSEVPGLFVHDHAHNVPLDIAVRYGFVLLVLSLFLLIVVLLTTWQKRLQENGASLAIAVYIIMAGMAETIFSWQYWGVYLVVLFYLAIDSGRNVKSDLDPSLTSTETASNLV